jgi:hypothetical protein
MSEISAKARGDLLEDALLQPDPAFPPYFLSDRPAPQVDSGNWRTSLLDLPWYRVSGNVGCPKLAHSLAQRFF